MPEQQKVSFLVSASDDERLLRLGLWVLSAASVGDSVDVLLTASPLRRWVKGDFGSSTPALAGLPTARALLEEARQLGGVRLVTCDTEVRLADLAEDVVKPVVDEIVSLPSFWRAATGRLVSV